MGERSGAGGRGGGGRGDEGIAELSSALPGGTFEAADVNNPSDTWSAARNAMAAIRESPATRLYEVAPTNADVGSLGGRGMDILGRGSPVILAGPRDGSRFDNIANRTKPVVARIGVIATPPGRGGTGDSSALVRFAGTTRAVRVRPGEYDVFSVPRPRALETPAGR